MFFKIEDQYSQENTALRSLFNKVAGLKGYLRAAFLIGYLLWLEAALMKESDLNSSKAYNNLRY